MWFFESRCETVANYILENEATIRQAAKVFGLSKSTIHNDVSKKLPDANYGLFVEVQRVLNKNFAEKHIRGGVATRLKYLKLHRAV